MKNILLPRPSFNRLLPFSVKIGALVLFFSLIAIYAYAKTQNLLRGPRIIIYEPANGSAFTGPLVEITGQAQRIANLFLNDGRIFTDEAGQFREKLLLAPGHNIIEVEASDKFGRTTRQILSLAYPYHKYGQEN